MHFSRRRHAKQDIDSITRCLTLADSNERTRLDIAILRLKQCCIKYGWSCSEVFDEFLQGILGTPTIDNGIERRQLVELTTVILLFVSYKKGDLETRIKRALYHANPT